MSSVKEASNSVNSFSMKLYSKLDKDKPRENLFFSPTSICVALAMTYAGAKGNTAKELEHAMDWSTPNTVHEMMKNLQGSLTPSSGVSGMELNLANRLWVQTGFPILKEFAETLRDWYRAEMGVVDFQNDTEEARKAINLWTEEKTNAKIKDLLKKGVLQPGITLVLTNAVYFKGSWQNQFQTSNTNDWDFKVTKSEKIKIKLMNITARFPYAKIKRLSCQVVKLLYKEQKVAMMILLPDKVDGLAKLEKKIDAVMLEECEGMLAERKVIVSLPKFKMDCQVHLKEFLRQLGMQDLFEPNANFSGITGNRDLFVAKVIHQAFIDVNEEGTEAAAATAVLMGRSKVRKEKVEHPPHFLADHPFLFIIQHCESGTILFIGRVVSPESSN